MNRILPRPRTSCTVSATSGSWAFYSSMRQVRRLALKIPCEFHPTTHNGAKKRALVRDNYRCVVTGLPQRDSIKDKGKVSCLTECTHIIPRSGVEPKSEGNLKLDYTSAVLAVLKQFGYDVEKFNRPKMHSLTNIMTLEYGVSSQSRENQYAIQCYGSDPHPSIRRCITFSTPDPDHLPVPDPYPCLLALYATCCKVAHLSGAAEHIDEIYRDADELDVLSTDGSLGEVLNYLLSLTPQPSY